MITRERSKSITYLHDARLDFYIWKKERLEGHDTYEYLVGGRKEY